jgi:Fe-Mn family superoxide dismutase
MSFHAVELPYKKNSLSPYVSEETVEFHYEKHHKGYVAKLNEIAQANATIASKSLEEIVKTETGKPFNMAAQIWNHDFYWLCMKPNGSAKPTGNNGKILKAIEDSFGSFDAFKKKFDEEAANHFGSGWAWLVRDQNNKLEVISTHDAGNPLTQGKIPVLTTDVWEHAYYIDYRNARPKYLENWWNCINWEFVEKQLA